MANAQAEPAPPAPLPPVVRAVNLSAPFIRRPVATTLITLGVAIAGALAFFSLPVSPLPQVDFPTISVSASLPGASPENVASSVATPLERHLGVIAGVTEMTSSSSVGNARITLQFDLDRDIDGAARDVQSAINAARADLPASLKSNPTYRKVNPADAPVLLLALTSDTLSQGQIYDAAASVLQQKLSQVPGIGQVNIGGSSLPAVRVELDPDVLFKYGIGLEDVRAALAAANANAPKGSIEVEGKHFQIYTDDQAARAAQYRELIVAYRDGAAVRLKDVADVQDSVEDLRNQGLANGKPAVLIIMFRQPGANIIETVDRVRQLLPVLKASIPATIDITPVSDRTGTIRSSLHDVEMTLVLSVFLVCMVVFVFLRNVRATLIPSVAVPISLIGTFAVMYALHYSLDNLSLMALTIATGFVVDDAIVVLENVTRHMELGKSRTEAALLGAKEVGFTVLSMSTSLVAVFIPLLFMGGIIGRLFREFAVTLSAAVMVSLAVSLVTTPVMCAFLLRHDTHKRPNAVSRFIERVFEGAVHGYDRTLQVALRHGVVTVVALAGVVVLNFVLLYEIPKGFFPQQDTGRLQGSIQADQSVSFQLMKQKLTQLISIVSKDPAVDGVAGFTGGGAANSGNVFVSLKPLAQRKESADAVIARLRKATIGVAGARLFFQAAQDIRVGGRASQAQYQYTLQSDDAQALVEWTPKIFEVLAKNPLLADVNIDQQNKGLETDLVVDRDQAARLKLSLSSIDNTLYDAFGQRQVSTIYNALNQYHVVMELAPRFWQTPAALDQLYVSTSGAALTGTAVTQGGSSNDAAKNAASAIGSIGRGGANTGAAVATRPETMIPLSAISHYGTGNAPLAINHQGLSVASTISFNLPPGKSLSDAQATLAQTMVELHVPPSIRGKFQGTAGAFEDSLKSEPWLIAAALLAIYIVLGVLYESLTHPLTILSTLPSAGVGAVSALLLTGSEFSIIALIGVILLIGIVKKNAIMMIDFAIDAQRSDPSLSPREAIHRACLLRFRPILMTTMAAALGAMPLAFGVGEGAELRRPLGISIFGGLLVSQALTLYTTPVIYLYLERARRWLRGAAVAG